MPVTVLLLSMMDVTERRLAEEALKQADREKDDFLALLAHELRNPLAPIRTAVQLLKMRRQPDAEGQRLHAVIDRQVQHLVRMVDDLLDVSRVLRGKVELRREPLDDRRRDRDRGRDVAAAHRRAAAGAAACDLPEPAPDGARRSGAAGAGDRQPAEQRQQVLARRRDHPPDGPSRPTATW